MSCHSYTTFTNFLQTVDICHFAHNTLMLCERSNICSRHFAQRACRLVIISCSSSTPHVHVHSTCTSLNHYNRFADFRTFGQCCTTAGDFKTRHYIVHFEWAVDITISISKLVKVLQQNDFVIQANWTCNTPLYYSSRQRYTSSSATMWSHQHQFTSFLLISKPIIQLLMKLFKFL